MAFEFGKEKWGWLSWSKFLRQQAGSNKSPFSMSEQAAAAAGQQQQQQARRGGIGGGEGKAAMSVELYKFLCGCFMRKGTIDGVFAHCFLVLSWNLACRSQNTSLIRFQDVSWLLSFDAFEIYFAHTKTDQLGDDAKYPRHLFANPLSPTICPVLSLALYFSCCFNTPVVPQDKLFPGRDQEERFAAILARLLRDQQAEIEALGYQVNELGTHSIRKGAVSYMASMPGGPPAASVCIRAGWTMGKVRDIYMRYVTSGDQFVGRCLSLLPLCTAQFACSPPFFVTAGMTDDNTRRWLENLRRDQFPTVSTVVGYGLLTRMCLASILYHRAWLIASFDVNHVVWFSSAVLRRADVVEKLESNSLIVKVSYPWANVEENAFSGIPPHCTILNELARARVLQQDIVDQFVERVKQAMTEYGVNNNQMNEQNIRNLLETIQEEMQAMRREVVGSGAGNQVQVVDERVERGQGYTLHFHHGSFRRVPADWQIVMSAGAFDMWRQWWIGDQIRQVPPLRFVDSTDLDFLDQRQNRQEGRVDDDSMEERKEQEEEEQQQRPTRKTMSDLRFLMRFIKWQVFLKIGERLDEAGRDGVTLTDVDRHFVAVADELSFGRARAGQHHWKTIVNKLRDRKVKVPREFH